MTIFVGRWCTLVFFGCTLVVVSGCGSAEEKKDSYVAKAREFIHEGNFPEASFALQHALKIAPNDSHVEFLAAQVSEKEARWPEAFRQYVRVVELDATHRAAMGRLARFYLAAQETNELQALSDKVLAQDPQDVLGRTIQACVWVLGKEKAKALAQADSLLLQNPTDPDILIMLAVVFSANHELKKAQSILLSGLRAHPGNVDLLHYLATILIGRKAFDKAEAIYLELLGIEPHVPKHWETLAWLYQYRGKSDKALALLREGVAKDPDNEQRWKSRMTYAETSQREELLKEALQTLTHSFMLQFLLGAHYEQVHDYPRAREVCEGIDIKEVNGSQGLKAEVELAKLDFAGQNPQSGWSRLTHVLQKSPCQFEALLLKGKLAVEQEEGPSAVDAFRLVLEEEPNNAAILSLLGQAHLLAGEFEMAKESLEKAVSLNSHQFDAYTALARLSARDGELEKAQLYLEDVLQAVPTYRETLGSHFQLQLAQGQWSQGEHTITRMLEAEESAYQLSQAHGLLAAGRQQWDWSVQALSRGQQDTSTALLPLTTLFKLYLERQQPEQAQAYLKKIVTDHPDHPFAWGLLGAVLVQLHETSSAIYAFQKATEVNPAWVAPWKEWARLRWSQGHKSDAIAILKVAITKHVQTPVLLYALASMYQVEGQVDLAMSQYESILRRWPSDFLAANNLAYLLADKKGDPQSLQRALALTRNFEVHTRNPFLLDTLAWVYYKMNLNKEASRVLNKALAQSPDPAILNYHFGLVALEAGDRVTAQRHLEKGLQGDLERESVAEVRQLLAEITQ